MARDDDYKARARKRASERSDSSWFKLKEGNNTFRILRTPVGKNTPSVYYEYKIHRDVGPKRRKLRCGKDLDGNGNCWMCDKQIPKLESAGKATRAAALEAGEEMVVQVAIVKDNDGEPKFVGPKVFSPSRTVGTQILTSVLGGKRDYVDHKKGYNVSLSRTGTGKMDTRYGVLDRDDEPTEVPDSITDKLVPFSKLKEVPVYSEDAMKAAYFGREEEDDEDENEEEDEVSKSGEDGEDEDEEEDEKPAPKAKGKKAKDVDEDEEDEDELEDAEDEEEEKPKPKGKAAAKKKDEEEDDEDLADLDDDDEPDDIEDEDEEDEKPVAKAKGKGKKAEVEEEDEEDSEDEDEEEEKPKRKSPAPPPSRRKK